MPFSTPTCYLRAALLRSPPIPPIPRPTACTLLTTRDPTEPLCLGPVYPAEDHRLAMFPTDSRIAAIPSIWLGWLHRTRHRSVPDTADHPEKATALLLTAWLVLLSTNVGAPTAPFSRLPWPKLSRPYQATNDTSRSAFQFTHQRTQANDEFSVFPQPQQTRDLSLPTQLFSYPPIDRILATYGPSAFFDDTTTDDLPNHSSPALARRCFRLHRLSHIHLGSPPRQSIPQCFFFLVVRVLLVQPSTDSVSVASEHRTVPLQPNGSESSSVPEDISATPMPPPPFCLNSPVILPPEPRQPLPVPEGTSVTPLSPPPLP